MEELKPEGTMKQIRECLPPLGDKVGGGVLFLQLKSQGWLVGAGIPAEDHLVRTGTLEGGQSHKN